MKISREEVLHIALLARLGLADDEVAKFSEQLSDIIDNFEILQKVDTTDVPPTAQPMILQNVLRDDKEAPSLGPTQTLANAPQREENYFRVKAVLE